MFSAQDTTLKFVTALQALMPDRPLNTWFQQIVTDGTGHVFAIEDNDRWLEIARPVLEARFHSRFMVKMAVVAAQELDEPPRVCYPTTGQPSCIYLT